MKNKSRERVYIRNGVVDTNRLGIGMINLVYHIDV